jgi:hypothetical protein
LQGFVLNLFLGALIDPRGSVVSGNGVEAKADDRGTHHQQRSDEEDGPFAVELEPAAEDDVKPTGTIKKIMMPMPPTRPVSRVSSESIQDAPC